MLKALIVREEFARVRAPREVRGNGTAMVLPTLLEHGTEAQKARFIPAILNGDLKWAQGYSEPQSGSDLASLRTRAELQDGQWVLNGQKIWSSFADECDWMYALVRTEPDAGKHDGISYLLVDLRQPGVTIRPIKAINGASRFCEVFFDNARTPEDMLVGPRGHGWAVSKSTLKHERLSIGGEDRVPFRQLLRLAAESRTASGPALQDPAVLDRLARIEARAKALTWSGYRQVSMRAEGREPGLIDLLPKLYSTNILHEVSALARDLIGDAFMLSNKDEDARGESGPEKWNNQFMGSLGTAIAGGTSNIQRNIIAERGLGLPRDA